MRIREVTPSPGNLFLRFVGCWGLLAQAFFETVRGQGCLVERHETGRKENEKRHTYTEENRERSTEEEKKH